MNYIVIPALAVVGSLGFLTVVFYVNEKLTLKKWNR